MFSWIQQQVPHTVDTQNVLRSCCSDYRFRTKVLLKDGRFYSHNSTRPDRLVFQRRFWRIMCQLSQIAHFLPTQLQYVANVWSVDNPATVGNVSCYNGIDGNIGYSYCPPPTCRSSLVIPDGDQRRTQTQALEKLLPGPSFEEKKMVGWRGSLTGHKPMLYDNSPLLFNKTSRQLLLEKCKDDSRMSCKVVNWKEMMTHQALQNNFRGIVSVAGGSYASNFADALYYHDTVPLRQDVPAMAWFEPFFEADKHYISLNRNLSNLKRCVDELFEPALSRNMVAISKSGRRQAQKVFSYEFRRRHFTDLFSRYARALRGSLQESGESWDPIALPYCRD